MKDRMQKQNRLNTLNSESTDHKLNNKFVTEQQQSLISQQQQMLKFRIECLEAELKNAKERQSKLRVTNTQLSNMILSSNQNGASRTEQYIQKIEDVILGKLKITYKNNLIDKKINEITKDTDIALGFQKKGVKQAKNHSRKMSNFSTLTSYGSQDSHDTQNPTHSIMPIMQRLNKKEIKDRISGVKRIEKQLYNI